MDDDVEGDLKFRFVVDLFYILVVIFKTVTSQIRMYKLIIQKILNYKDKYTH